MKPIPALPGGADKKKAMPALPGGATEKKTMPPVPEKAGSSSGRPRSATGAGGAVHRVFGGLEVQGNPGKTPPLPSKAARGMPALPQRADEDDDDEEEEEEEEKEEEPAAAAMKPIPALPGGADKKKAMPALPGGATEKKTMPALPVGKTEKKTMPALPAGKPEKKVMPALPAGKPKKKVMPALPVGKTDASATRSTKARGALHSDLRNGDLESAVSKMKPDTAEEQNAAAAKKPMPAIPGDANKKKRTPALPGVSKEPSSASPPSLHGKDPEIEQHQQQEILMQGPAGRLVGALFDAIDTDGSGFLEEAEGKYFFKTMGCDPDELDYYWKDLLRCADSNADGMISKEEFVRYTMGDLEVNDDGTCAEEAFAFDMRRKIMVLGPAGKLVSALFDTIDADGSGFLDAEEGKRFLAAAGCDDPSELEYYWQDFLRTADENHDGNISKDEFLSYILGDEELHLSGDFADPSRSAELSSAMRALGGSVGPSASRRIPLALDTSPVSIQSATLQNLYHTSSPTSGTVCRLENRQSGMFLCSNVDDESIIEQVASGTSANAEWTFVDALSGSPRRAKHTRPEFYCVLNRESMLCLSIGKDQVVTVSDDADAYGAHWSIMSGPTSSDYECVLKNRATSQYLRMSSNSAGALAELCSNSTSVETHWRIDTTPGVSRSPETSVPSSKPVLRLDVDPLRASAKATQPGSPKSGTVCRIENEHSGLMLRCNEDDESVVEQWEPDSAVSAEWTLLDATNSSPGQGRAHHAPEYYCLLNRLSMLCLSTKNGAHVTVSDDADVHDAHWSIEYGKSDSTGVFALKSRACGKYLGVREETTACGARVQLCNDADARTASLWRTVPTSTETPKREPALLKSPESKRQQAAFPASLVSLKSTQCAKLPPPPPMSAQRMLRRAQLLQTVPMFADLTLKEQTDIAAELQLVKYAAGGKVCQQGHKADAMFIVEEGALAADIGGHVVKQYWRGGAFGELALLSGKRRAATVTAIRASKCLRLSRDQFQKCAKNSSATLWSQIQDYAAGRIQAAWRGEKDVRDLMDGVGQSDTEEDSNDESDIEEEVAPAGLRTKEDIKKSVILTLMEVADGDVLDKRGGIFRSDEMKMQTIEMFGLEEIEYETFMRIVLKMQASFRRKIEWKKMVLQTIMAQMGDEPKPEPVKPFPPQRPTPQAKLARAASPPVDASLSKSARTVSPAARVVDASIAARRSQTSLSPTRTPTRQTSSPGTSPLPPVGSPVSTMIAATATESGASSAEYTELLRQQLATAAQPAHRRGALEGRRTTAVRRQMESIAVSHAVTDMIVKSSKVACTRMTALSKLSGESGDDSDEEQLQQVIELQRNVESFGTRLLPVLSSLLVKAAEDTGLYKQQIELEAARETSGYTSSQVAPSWTKPIFSTGRAQADTERRVAQLVRIQRTKTKPPAAYYDGHSLNDIIGSLQVAADSLEAVLAALSEADRSETLDAFDTFFHTPIGQKRVEAREHLNGALEAMEKTLDTLAAIDMKLPSQAAGGVSPALARAFAGAASPVSKAARTGGESSREPLVSMNLSKRTVAPPTRPSSSPSGVSFVWAFGSDTKAAVYQSPLRRPAATTHSPAPLRYTASASSPQTTEYRHVATGSPRPATAAEYHAATPSPRPAAPAYSSPIRGLSALPAARARARGGLQPSTRGSPAQSALTGETEYKRVALQNLMRSSSIPTAQAARAGAAVEVHASPTATAALASGVPAATVADVVSRQISSAGSPGACSLRSSGTVPTAVCLGVRY